MQQKFEMNIYHIDNFILYLKETERAEKTQEKYRHDLYVLLDWLEGKELSKMELIKWKESLITQYAPQTVNGLLTAANSFFRFMGWSELRIRPLKIQRTLFYDERKELSREEYVRLVRTARNLGNDRLAMILQTICATGIRVSELCYVTCESLLSGRTEVNNKGKIRTVFLPEKLCRLLKKYIKKQRLSSGPIFVTRTGRAVDRSNIWREMKKLCESAGVAPEKVFPHNLRHLFARCFYAIEKDLCRLADLLGHVNINTTRIYTAQSAMHHVRLLGRMNLVIT